MAEKLEFTDKQREAIKSFQSKITERLQKRAAKRTDVVRFDQGVYDVVMFELPYQIARLMMDMAIETAKLQRQVEGLIEKDARAMARIAAAAEQGRRRAMVTKAETQQEAAGNDG
jgi:hypothetical protein